jgi:hypothetical protein
MMGEAYKRYMNNWDKELPRIGPCTQEEFINKIKTDDVFAKKWGVIVEVRELELGERQAILEKKGYRGLLHSNVKKYKSGKKIFEVIRQTCDSVNIPTKSISLTYDNQTEVIYE